MRQRVLERQHRVFDQEVSCTFQDPDPEDPRGGMTPKFWCVTADGEDFKVKYETERENGHSGNLGEVMSTRFFWALGFPVDAMYPVRVNCLDCPPLPWRYLRAWYNGRAGDPKAQAYVAKMDAARKGQLVRFDNAVIELKYKATLIERYGHQGWDWSEYDAIDPALQGELKAQRDALALLAAFVMHADNKPEQQRLICLDTMPSGPRPTTCDKPVALIQDLGFSWGAGWEPNPSKEPLATASLQGFITQPVWSDPERCITNVRSYGPTGTQSVRKKISEAGRALVAKLLADSLTDQDMLDLFTAARLQFKGEWVDGHPVTPQDWLQAYKIKRKGITEHQCPP
jgi:hypothetical protein